MAGVGSPDARLCTVMLLNKQGQSFSRMKSIVARAKDTRKFLKIKNCSTNEMVERCKGINLFG
jgi:hypothetical protein